MKVLVCCFFVILNIQSNGRASLDSFTPINSNNYLEDGTKNTDTCYRPCKFNVQPKRCYHTFKLEPSILDDGRPGLTINGITPGPPIFACVNDVIVIEIENRIPDQDVSFHWHGVEQKGTPYMDGVPMVTQCPVYFGGKYKYAFIAASPGTFFYHAHSVSHQSDGLYGSLIVSQPAPLEPQSSLYDYDRSQDNTLVVGARFPVLMTGNLEDMSLVKPEKLLINGEEENAKLFVSQGFAYRVRLINAIAVECPVIVSIDRHEMIAIATDGRPVKPVSTRTVQLYPGERIDVVVRASQESGGYWVRVKGTGVCASVTATAMLLYSGFNYTSMLENSQTEIPDNVITAVSIPINGQMLESFKDVPYISEPKQVYLGIDRNIVKEKENDFRYISDAIPKKPFFPAYLSLQDKGIVQINGKNFLYPNVPILLRPRDVVSDKVCLVEEERKQPETQCVQILNNMEGEGLEIALVNEGFGGNNSYTFHIHGTGVQVIATGTHPNNSALSKADFNRLNREGKIIRNSQNPPIKDTFNVPNKGYTIIRVRPDKGSWLLECRSCSLSSLPAAILIQIPQTMPKAVLQALPKCGNYRPPDVLLN